ncbi:MAG: YHS domain-containing protein [Candidatus Omnitrophota bacterium]
MPITKKNFILMAAAIFCSCAMLSGNGACEDQVVKTEATEDTEPEIYANNLMCPVSEDDIVIADAVKYKYNGKIYYFCCEACVKHFKKHPDKFAQKARMF